MKDQNKDGRLNREIGLWGGMALGLGSIIGAGVFVSLGLAATLTGPLVLLAIVLAFLVALCNGLNSAQLAANYPVSGGTYAYGYRLLNPRWGFAAGWMFLCAKSASAATAVLAIVGYANQLLGRDATTHITWYAFFLLVVIALLVVGGIRKSNWVNLGIVSFTVLSLLGFIFIGLSRVTSTEWSVFTVQNLLHQGKSNLPGIFEATALVFVAYTGYGRIATLGEEVKDPRKTIPRAIWVTLIFAMLLYMGIALIAVSFVGGKGFGQLASQNAAPLSHIANLFHHKELSVLMSLAAITAMFGVTFNLVLGLSRVLLAMGRQGDMPICFSWVNAKNGSPWVAILACISMIAVIVSFKSIRLAWSFSAFTVLIYYGITNLAATRIPQEKRLYPLWLSYLGLTLCLFLGGWIEKMVWLWGFGCLFFGLIWQTVMNWFIKNQNSDPVKGG